MLQNIIQHNHHNHLKHRRLRFLRAHQQAFDVELNFPLPIFEQAVLEIEGSCFVEPSCKVEGGRLLAGRYEVAEDLGKAWPECLTYTFKFLDKIDSRLGVNINRQPFEQFAAAHVGSGKIMNNTIGIHLDSKFEDSSIMLYVHIEPESDPEELARTAIALDGGYYSDELTQVLIKDTLVIGFELFFDGRSRVDICPSASAQPEGLGSKGKYLTPYIQKNFSQKVNSVFRGSDVLTVSFSKAYPQPIFWFLFRNTKDISKYFLFNSLGNKIYDFCQSQSCIVDATVAVTEQDLAKTRLENFCFYYDQRDECQPHPDYE